MTSKANGVRRHDQLSDRARADFLATQKFIDSLAGTKPIYTRGTIRWLARVAVSSEATLSPRFRDFGSYFLIEPGHEPHRTPRADPRLPSAARYSLVADIHDVDLSSPVRIPVDGVYRAMPQTDRAKGS